MLRPLHTVECCWDLQSTRSPETVLVAKCVCSQAVCTLQCIITNQQAAISSVVVADFRCDDPADLWNCKFALRCRRQLQRADRFGIVESPKVNQRACLIFCVYLGRSCRISMICAGTYKDFGCAQLVSRAAQTTPAHVELI